MNINKLNQVKNHNIFYSQQNDINQPSDIYINFSKKIPSKEFNKYKVNNFPSKKYSNKNNISLEPQFNHTYPNFFPNPGNKYHDIEYSFKSNTNISLVENELKSLKLDYITLNNDNIILREDINQLSKLNKQLEYDLEEERSHNFELAKQNDTLNNEREKLYRKIDEVNQRISEIKSKTKNEEILFNNQIYLEEKINEKDFQCKSILDENNKLNQEYNILKDKYLKLQEKNDEDEKELNTIKIKQEEKLNEIENKMEILIEEINNLKNENNKLKNENENYKNKIMNKEKEKENYYNKYKEQIIINEMINKENEKIKLDYLEYKNYLNKKEKKEIANEKLKKNNSENKIRIIKDLQDKIQRYKTQRTKNFIDSDECEDY